jgi:hypothetical protein
VSAENNDYLKIVRDYADTMIEYGRDRYGEKHSPLFAAALDMEPLSLFEGEKLKEIANLQRDQWGIRTDDRTLTGANVMHHQNLYQILYGLTTLTKDKRYAEEADKSLTWFFNHCQSPETGLMVWGEHLGWDFNTDTAIQVGRERMTHEFFRPWVMWERTFQLVPNPCIAFARGLWEHQIYDHATGNFSRHAWWNQHKPDRNSQFPRHAGFFIATWSEAYYHTKDPVFLTAIETLLNLYERHADRNTGAIPAEIGNPRSPENNMLWPQQMISIAIDLWDASSRVPESLGSRMRDFAAGMDTVYNNMKHKLKPGEEGFITQSNTKTLEPEDIRNKNFRVYSHLWATGYGEQTDANVANMIYLRYKQSKYEGYKNLLIAAADRYLNTEPFIEFPVYPGTLGDVIYLMLGAYELSGDNKYLNRAEHFAGQSISMFFHGNSRLPSASSKHFHYEAITGDDTLMMAFLKLHAVKSKKESGVSLIWNDR